MLCKDRILPLQLAVMLKQLGLICEDARGIVPQDMTAAWHKCSSSVGRERKPVLNDASFPMKDRNRICATRSAMGGAPTLKLYDQALMG